MKAIQRTFNILNVRLDWWECSLVVERLLVSVKVLIIEHLLFLVHCSLYELEKTAFTMNEYMTVC